MKLVLLMFKKLKNYFATRYLTNIYVILVSKKNEKVEIYCDYEKVERNYEIACSTLSNCLTTKI